MDDFYVWLRVLQHTHSGFANHGIVVDDTEERRNDVGRLVDAIECSVTFQDGDATDSFEDRMESERFGQDVENKAHDERLFKSSCAVHKPPGVRGSSAESASVIQSMLDILNEPAQPEQTVAQVEGAVQSAQPIADAEEVRPAQTGVVSVQPTPPVVVIQRAVDPVVEWAQNGDMTACAFPHLFMLGGIHLPNGTWNAEFVGHLMN